jgi:hypothetical protein
MFIIKTVVLLLIHCLYSYSQECENGSDSENGVCIAKSTNVKVPKGANIHGKPVEVDMNVCNDRHPQCTGYAENGECVKNPGWMIVNCPVSCNACHLLDPKIRCQRSSLNMTVGPAFGPGEMNLMFNGIVNHFSSQFDVKVLSSDPWLVQFDNFITDEEIDAIISTVEGNWERSTDTGFYLSIYKYIYLSIYLSTYLSIYKSIHLTIYELNT